MVTKSVKIALRSLETVANKGFLALPGRKPEQDFSVLKRRFEQADFFHPPDHFPTFHHFPPLLPLFSPLIPHFPPHFHHFFATFPHFCYFHHFPHSVYAVFILLLNICITKQQKLKQKLNFKN